MNCWTCNSELIWGGDHDFEDYGMEGDGIVSNLSCPECGAFVLHHAPVDVPEASPLEESDPNDPFVRGYRIGYWQMKDHGEKESEKLKQEIQRWKEIAKR